MPAGLFVMPRGVARVAFGVVGKARVHLQTGVRLRARRCWMTTWSVTRVAVCGAAQGKIFAHFDGCDAAKGVVRKKSFGPPPNRPRGKRRHADARWSIVEAWVSAKRCLHRKAKT
jgi:hypothetical protein